jgi:hypothetical protein
MTELENPSIESPNPAVIPPAKPATMWPADYYSSPTPSPVLPQWVPFGCGGLALLVLIIVFAGGAFLASGGFIEVMDFAIGMTVSEMKGQYAADVTPAQKKTLDDETTLLRKNLRDQTITIVAMQPFFERLRDVSSDKKVTAQEAQSLVEIARKVNGAAGRKAQRRKGSEAQSGKPAQ